MGNKNPSLYISGIGCVGNAILELASKLGLYIVGISSSTDVILKPTQEQIAQILNIPDHQGRKEYISEEGQELPEDIAEILDKGTVFIDVSGNPDLDLHPTLLEKGFVVTANKIPVACSNPEVARQMIGNERYGYDTTVMAGQGAINRLKQEKELGTKILSLDGIFSGTLAYITKELQKGTDLSKAIENAMNLGFTETNPMDDLDGKDVAKKLVILARTLGYDVSLKDVDVEGLLDGSFRNLFSNGVDDESKSAFIEKIRDQKDEEFKILVNENKPKVPRYVAKINFEGENINLKVSLDFVDPNSELGVAESNKMVVRVDRGGVEGNNHFGIIGNGAGPFETAGGLIRDLRTVLNR